MNTAILISEAAADHAARATAEVAAQGPVDHWHATIAYTSGKLAHHDFYLPAGADEQTARYWAHRVWHMAQRGRDGEWVDPSLKVTRVIDHASSARAA